MKRFLLFGGPNYYPHGGACDYRGCFDDLDGAIAAGQALRDDWWNVLDMEQEKLIAAGQNAPTRTPTTYY